VRASPQPRSVAKESSEPKRIERTSNAYTRSSKQNGNSQKQVMRGERSVAKRNYEKR